MTNSEVIADLWVDNLTSEAGRAGDPLRLLAFDDHLLRRFGQLDLVRKDPGSLDELSLRSAADEVWLLIEGQAAISCRDMRPGSPSENREYHANLISPSRILVPFGVAFGWQAVDGPAIMLRCATHQDNEHSDDRVIPLEPGS